MTNKLETIHYCTPDEAYIHMETCLKAGLVPYVQSSPGIGKSALAKKLANKWNLKLIDHRLSTSAPEDLSGLPQLKDGRALFAPFAELFPLEGEALPVKRRWKDADGNEQVEYYDGWLLFLDELPSAPRSVQAAAYKLILDREVGQHNLHKRCLIMAAGNLATDKAIVNPIGTAMQSRLVHIMLQVDFKQWLMNVALPEKYDQRVVAFLSYKNSALMDFNPNHENATFCCPRTWEFMNKLVKVGGVNSDQLKLFVGTISPGTAAEFVNFCEVYSEMVSLAQVLADPEGCNVPFKTGLKYATITHLIEKVDAKNAEKVLTYINRFDMPFRILFFRAMTVQHPDLVQSPHFLKAITALGKYLYES